MARINVTTAYAASLFMRLQCAVIVTADAIRSSVKNTGTLDVDVNGSLTGERGRFPTPHAAEGREATPGAIVTAGAPMKTPCSLVLALAVAAIASVTGQTIDSPRYRLVDLSHGYGPSTLYWPTSTTKFWLTRDADGPTPGGWFYAAYTLEHARAWRHAPRCAAALL